MKRPAEFTEADRQLWRTLVSRVRRYLNARQVSTHVTLMGAAAKAAARKAVLPPAWQADPANPASELATLAQNWWRLTLVDRERQKPRLAQIADAVSAVIEAEPPSPPDRFRADVDG